MSPLAQSTPSTATMSPARGRVDFLALVGVHPHDAAEALLPAGALVEVRCRPWRACPGRCRMNVNWPKGSSTILNAMRHDRLVGIGLQRHLLRRHRRSRMALTLAVQRRGQVADHRVQQRLHALVAVGRAQEHRRELLALARPRVTIAWISSSGDFLLGQQQLHQLVAVHRQGFEHVLAGGGGLVGQLGGNRLDADLSRRCRRRSRWPSS